MRRGLCILAVLLLAGCSSIGYYGQSVHGQLGVMAASRPMDDVVADPRTPDPVRTQLEAVPELRVFATAELALPESSSYRLYADVRRDALVWNVVAAPVDSLEPRQWCYPVIGCASYRGYFDHRAAQAFAEDLAADGWDAAVEPVPAYSTLGWFSDPLPSTVIDWPLAEIAGLLFHELAHEALYVKGDSAFNEAYATVVEQEGVRRWLAQHGDAEQRKAYAWSQRRRREFLGLLARTRQALARLYAAGLESAELLPRKAAIFEQLRDGYAELKRGWEGYPGYDRWFQRPLNNAHLASINTYHALVPAFRFILQRNGGDMAGFHAECRRIASATPDERAATMAELAAEARRGSESPDRVQR